MIEHLLPMTRRCKVSILAFQSLKNYFWTLNCIDVQFCSLLWSSCCLGLENEGLLGSASPTKKIILLHKMVIIWILFLMTVWSGCFLCFMYSSSYHLIQLKYIIERGQILQAEIMMKFKAWYLSYLIEVSALTGFLLKPLNYDDWKLCLIIQTLNVWKQFLNLMYKRACFC